MADANYCIPEEVKAKIPEYSFTENNEKTILGFPLEELYELAQNGQVVVLPCKVGDTVYVTFSNGHILPFIVDRIHILANSEVQVRLRDFFMETVRLSASEFGKTVFITSEEAEAALQERGKTK